MARLLLAIVSLALVQCAIVRPDPDAFAFAVMGDTPYTAREEKPFLQMIERIGEERVAFVVHVGDFLRGGPCPDSTLEKRRAQLDLSAHPLVYTPGDNEWIDCGHGRSGELRPVARLESLRRIFFAQPSTLGKRRFETQVQNECVRGPESACECARYVENRRWTMHRVVFATVNFPGHDNNEGRDAEGDAEARCRNAANRAWIERAIRAAESPGVAALVVFTQANPWFSPNHAFDWFVAQLEEGAARIRKPLLFVHGDTHIYRVDNPFRDAMGNPLANLTRLETHGSPFVGWVRVDVDPSRPDVFTFDPRLVAFVPPSL